MLVPALCRLGRLVLRPLLAVLLLTLLVVVVVLLSPLVEWIIKTMLIVMVMIWRIFLYPDSSRSATRETMPAKWQPSTKHSTAASSFDTFHHMVILRVVKNIITILLRPVVMRMTNSEYNGYKWWNVALNILFNLLPFDGDHWESRSLKSNASEAMAWKISSIFHLNQITFVTQTRFYDIYHTLFK